MGVPVARSSASAMRERVGVGDLGVAVGADGQQVAAVAGSRSSAWSSESVATVRPLQIVQEERQRALGGGERLQRLGSTR